jgi:hypothetical protein
MKNANEWRLFTGTKNTEIKNKPHTNLAINLREDHKGNKEKCLLIAMTYKCKTMKSNSTANKNGT